MKNAKKMLALIIALIMVAAIAIPAMAVTAGQGDTVNAMNFTLNPNATTDGKISLENATEGTTYTLYKIFDATYSENPSDQNNPYVSYTIKATDAIYSVLTDDTDPNNDWADYFTVGKTPDANGNYSITRTMNSNTPPTPVKDDAALITKLKTLAPATYFKNIGAIEASANGTIEWEKIPYGYYMIVPDKPSENKLVTIDTNNPTAMVIDKNNAPEFDKNIVIRAASEGNTALLQKWNEAGLDIEVPFEIKLTAERYYKDEKIFKYIVYDMLDPGFTLTSLPDVKINGTTATAVDTPDAINEYSITYKTAANGTDVTVTNVASAKDAQYFEIIIPWTDDGTYNGNHIYPIHTEVLVTYKAKLDPEKAALVHVGSTANNNVAGYNYYYDKDTPNVPSGNPPTVLTKTWETSLTIQKQDNNNKALVGAEFTLTTENGTKVSYIYSYDYVEDQTGTFYKLKDGTYTDEAPTTDPTHDEPYEDTQKKYKAVLTAEVRGENQTNTSMTAAVGPDGKVTFSGLGTGTYTLSETKVPEGFNKAEDITFTISFSMRNGFNPSALEDRDGIFASDNNKVVLRGTSNVFDVTIVNNPGTELPSTGGIGTTIFYIIGGILVVGAGVVLVARKKTKDD